MDELIQGFEEDVFCNFVNDQFSGSFSRREMKLPVKKDFLWEDAHQLGVVKTLAGGKGSNLPLLVVAVKLREGEVLTDRSSRIKQFTFAKQVLDDAMSQPSPDVEGVLSQGLFAFYDDAGNFRLSLVHGRPEGTKLAWSTAKRFSFYVEAGQANKTFRDRAGLAWTSFENLKDAFSVEKLTKEFYNRLFGWYQWALSDEVNVTYPNKTDTHEDDREINDHIIRLITRLMFVWFLKQKHLVPDTLFDPEALTKLLKDFSSDSGDSYYRAILQNLFFATLNSEISERGFATQTGDRSEHFDVKTLYRYPKEFSISEEEVLELFKGIPFLNGGLFECLDKRINYSDGFSRNRNKQACIPNQLFFDPVKGIIPLLQQYHFTVEENSPGDEEVALDPELLGKVFENLLGATNPETKVAARNATGSFYTPREIVNYMVDESLIAHLTTACGEAHQNSIRNLFSEGERPADHSLCKAMDQALLTAKILDPACGSGAFPMGILLRMVEVLRTLRGIPAEASVYDLKLELIENCIYGGDIQCIAVQISKLRFFISLVCEQKPTDDADQNYGINTLPNLETKFVAANSLIGLPDAGKDVLDLCTGDIADLKEQLFEVRRQHFNARNYKQKQALRKEDKKLRALIKRTVQQDAKPDRKHLDLLLKEREKVAKPKWTAKATAAKPAEMFAEFDSGSAPEQTQIDAHEKARKKLDAEIAREEKKVNLPTTVVDEIADMLAEWDPYDQNTSANFSDPEWMFNVSNGFDVVIGNPPYGISFSGQIHNMLKNTYKTYALRGESYVLFVERSVQLLLNKGHLSLIIPDTYLNLGFTQVLRDFLLAETILTQIYVLPSKVFASAVVDTTLLFSQKDKRERDSLNYEVQVKHISKFSCDLDLANPINTFNSSAQIWNEQNIFNVNSSSAEAKILQKVDFNFSPLSDFANVFSGIKAYEVGKGKPTQTKEIRKTKPYTSAEKKEWVEPIL